MSDTDTQRGGARPRPVYNPQLVDEIPDEIVMPRSGPRVNPRFNEGLQLAVANPGRSVELGQWMSEGGAHNQFKRIKNKEIKVPDGDWSFEPRRVWATDEAGEQILDDDGKPKRWSKLFAIFEGPVTGE